MQLLPATIGDALSAIGPKGSGAPSSSGVRIINASTGNFITNASTGNRITPA